MIRSSTAPSLPEKLAHAIGAHLRGTNYEDIARWLSEAGFGGARRLNLLKVPGSGLVLGTKAA